MRHQASAVPAGARTKVNHIIRPADGFFVVLHHQHGVAQVAQFFKRLQQPAVIAMVQSNGRLVQNIEDAAQFGSNLRSQTDALSLAAGERTCRALERDVAQPHRIQKLQALDDLVNDAPGDDCFAPVKFDLPPRFQRTRHRQRGEVGDRHAIHLHRQALRT